MSVKARKKPIVVDVLQYNGDNKEQIKFFVGDKCEDTITEFGIQTLEGFMKISNGDYIIRGVNGEHYPCKQDIFEKTYELV